MARRGRTLQAQVEFMERTGQAIEELVVKMMKAHEEQETYLVAFAASLEDVAAHETCAPLAKCLEALRECGQSLVRESHDVMMTRPETEILEVVAQMNDWAVTPMKRLLEDREKAVKIEVKLQRELEEIKLQRGSAAKEKERKLRMLSDQKRRVENVNALLDIHMESFERYRIEKMKKIVSELTRSQAFYHAKGLELFAVPCQAIAKLYAEDVGLSNATAQASPS